MADRPIDPRVHIGAVRLAVANLDRSLLFYGDVLGFQITQRTGSGRAVVTAGGHPLIYLTTGDVREAGRETSGVSRYAVRYPDRASLGDALRRLSGAGVPIDAALDRGAGESLHVRDPDGHQVELYYDRPLEQRSAGEEGEAAGATALDLQSLLAAANETDAAAAAGISAGTTPGLTGATRQRLGDTRARLLTLHKVLLDEAKAAYELDRGRVGSNASLLQLVINDPWFAWLHPLSELIVRIDETLQADAPATEADGAILLDQVGRLLSPAEGAGVFAQRYYEALQRQPAVIVAHAEVRRILKQAK